MVIRADGCGAVGKNTGGKRGQVYHSAFNMHVAVDKSGKKEAAFGVDYFRFFSDGVG